MPVGQLLDGYTIPIDNSESALEPSVDSYKYIAFKYDASISLKDNYQHGSDVVILIGPEGDFTEEELDLARKANFTALSLGHTRLRTETAAIAAVASVHAMNY
jgi:16S rRNA (uracil1498-N3)-methyltransferase